MAKMKKYVFAFDAPTGANTTDIKGFKVYVVADGTAFAYTLPSTDVPLVAGTPTYELDLATKVTADGKYDVYVTSYDAAGNESDASVLEDTVIDFTAPAKPVNLRLR